MTELSVGPITEESLCWFRAAAAATRRERERERLALASTVYTADMVSGQTNTTCVHFSGGKHGIYLFTQKPHINIDSRVFLTATIHR